MPCSGSIVITMVHVQKTGDLRGLRIKPVIITSWFCLWFNRAELKPRCWSTAWTYWRVLAWFVFLVNIFSCGWQSTKMKNTFRYLVELHWDWPTLVSIHWALTHWIKPFTCSERSTPDILTRVCVCVSGCVFQILSQLWRQLSNSRWLFGRCTTWRQKTRGSKIHYKSTNAKSQRLKTKVNTSFLMLFEMKEQNKTHFPQIETCRTSIAYKTNIFLVTLILKSSSYY